MAKKSTIVMADTGEMTARSPISKLHDKIRQLDNLHSAANPGIGGYGPANVRAPKEIEAAANLVGQHIDGVLASARKSMKSAPAVKLLAGNPASTAKAAKPMSPSPAAKATKPTMPAAPAGYPKGRK